MRITDHNTCIREKLREINRIELDVFSNKIVDEVRRDFWEVEQVMQEELWGGVSENGQSLMTDVLQCFTVMPQSIFLFCVFFK